jgi:uracil DNA glycosylase
MDGTQSLFTLPPLWGKKSCALLDTGPFGLIELFHGKPLSAYCGWLTIGSFQMATGMFCFMCSAGRYMVKDAFV